MSLKIFREQDVIQEAMLILFQNLPLSKMALLLSHWQSGQGDYLQLKEHLFTGETVDSLGEEVLAFEEKRSQE